MADKTKALLAREPEIVAALRHCPVVECAHCAFAGEECKLGEPAATLIEAMAAENAQLRKQLAAVTAERDAAVESWCGFCAKCKWNGKQHLSDGKMDDRCKTCRENNKCNWQWRGPQGAGEVDHE